MSKTLFIRPSHDDVTSYLFFYSKELLQDSELRGFITLNKEKKDANTKMVEDVIEKNNPRFIMFNGHGSPVTICGHNNEVLVNWGKNHALLKNKITYSLSCSSAAKLGKKTADEVTTFIGYVEDFALGMDIYCQASIQKDQRARLFLEPSNLLVKSLLKGNVAKEAVQKAKELMKKNISILRTDPFPDAKDYVPYLFNNYLALKAFGNETLKLE